MQQTEKFKTFPNMFFIIFQREIFCLLRYSPEMQKDFQPEYILQSFGKWNKKIQNF